MSNIDKRALRNSSDRDWFENWFKREFHPDKTGPYIKDQLFFAVRAARAPLLDELEAAERRNAELINMIGRHTVELGWGEKPITLAELIIAREGSGSDVLDAIRAAAAGKGEAS
ncbi:hypothetical protein [Enterobacter kobei]